MRFLPILLMLLVMFRTDIVLAQGPATQTDAGAPSDTSSDIPDSQMLMNSNNVAPPPPTDEYNNVPPGMLTSDDEGPVTITQEPLQSDSDVMTMDEILEAYKAGRFPVVVRHLLPIANNNYPQAQELLGIMYAKGEGVTQDYESAVGWLTKAAEKDRPLAEHYLATLTFAGTGVSPDPVAALMWLYLAVVHYPEGPDRARALQDRENLSSRLSRRDRLRAFEMAHDWLKRKDEVALFDEEAAPH